MSPNNSNPNRAHPDSSMPGPRTPGAGAPSKPDATPKDANNANDANAEEEDDEVLEVQELQARDTLRLSILGDLEELPWPRRIAKTLNKHYFSLACIAAIVAAAVYPAAGRSGGPIDPALSSGWVAVVLIFLITGVTLPTSEIGHALLRWRVNSFAQLMNCAFFPVFVYLVTLALRPSSFDDRLLDATIILACIPTSVSMSVVMTKTAAGNEAIALCNASFGNAMGIFLTPAWLLGLMGAKTTVSFGQTILQLTYKVLVPLIAGQLLRHSPKHILDMQQFTIVYRVYFKRANESLLAFQVYTIFCDTFYNGTDASADQIVSLTGLLIALMIIHMVITWYGSGVKVLGCDARDRVAVLFTGTQKTLALGIPLINTIYAGSDNLGLYCLPLLIYHPIQLVCATAILSKLREFVIVNSYKHRGSQLKGVRVELA